MVLSNFNPRIDLSEGFQISDRLWFMFLAVTTEESGLAQETSQEAPTTRHRRKQQRCEKSMELFGR